MTFFMHMFVSHACGGGPRTLTHAVTIDTPIRCPRVVYHLGWRAREGFDQRWIPLSPCFSEDHGEIPNESLGACVHVCAHCTRCEPPCFFSGLRRCHIKGVHWVFKTSHNTSVHMLGQHGGGGCPRTPPPFTIISVTLPSVASRSFVPQ